jgi:hypothetical protein
MMLRTNKMEMKIFDMCHFSGDSAVCRYISLVYALK